ncbi:uncharacterized protein F4822DRAFT_210719 [Hypoxylon trugodes]|uniref:uncharacterized protein n=1 Tax=Hypoxylon trugodes TaxID=326681 RepID=UPI002190D4E5|nr:uncharacterized protein F4822DRAFT_210719 [Hypoxylon trugodes]KAI1389706.1 hypothetical protein F4822DRAFT_210719 [Hypoxylon trugodes]
MSPRLVAMTANPSAKRRITSHQHHLRLLITTSRALEAMILAHTSYAWRFHLTKRACSVSRAKRFSPEGCLQHEAMQCILHRCGGIWQVDGPQIHHKRVTTPREDQIYFCEYHDCFCAKKKWAFQCRAWERCNFFHYELKTIHRQRDQIFTGILQKIRVGDALSYGQTNLFMNHVSAVENTTRIVPTDGEAREINQCKFGQLNTELVTYKCLDNFQWNKKRHPNLESKGTRLEDGSLLALSHHRCERQLELKPGTYVVYIGSNKPLKSTQGVIREFRPFDTKNPPYSEPGKKRLFAPRGLCEAHVPVWDSQIHKYIDSAEKKMWPVVEFLDGKTEVIYAECEFLNVGNTMPYSTLTRTQIPLVPAWSMSVNQCLSLTLDRIIVDLSKAWEEGQLYMALSRASALKGLRVEGDPKDLVAGKGGNPDAKDFYDSFDIGTLFWGI